MKKYFFIAVTALASVSFAQAQLNVSESGNVGIKLPNTTDNPLSALSVGGTGSLSYFVDIDASSFTKTNNSVLNVRNANAYSDMYGLANGIRSYITGNSSYYYISIWGETSKSSSSSSGYGIGVVGLSGSYDRNYGVAGGISNSTSNGTGILGQTTNSLISIPTGRYAGYFSGDVVVTGTINGVTISPSDVSYKQNIEDVSGKKILNNILSLRPISYNLKQRYLGAWENGKTKQVAGV
jgi:hypothetical protein